MAKDLQLNVLLSAIDKATGPLKNINKVSAKTAKALKADREQLKKLNKTQKNVGQFKQLRRGSEQTQAALRAQQDQVKRLSQQIQGTAGSTKRLNQQRRTAIKRARKLKDQHAREQKQLHGLRSRINRVVGATGTLADKEARLAKQIARTNNRIERQKSALKKLGEANIGGRFNNMTGEIRRFGRRATLAVGAAGAAIFGLAKSTADLGDGANLAATKLGMNIERLQEYRYAAGIAGISTQKFDANIERFVKRLGEAANDTGAAKKAFEQLGLDAKQLSQMAPGDAFEAVADALANVDNRTRQLALASKFFGRRGVAMVNMMNEGSKSLRDMADQAQRTGYVLGQSAADDASAFADQMLRTQMTLAGVKNTIGVALLPAVTDLMTKLAHWLQTNHDKVVAFAHAFGEGLKSAVPIIKDLAIGVFQAARTLAHVVSTVADLVGGFKNLGMIVTALFASKVIASILSFGVGIGKAGSALITLAGGLPAVVAGIKAITMALFANPVGLTIAAIAGAAVLIYKYWGPIKDFFGDLWSGVKNVFSGGLSKLTKLLGKWNPAGLIYKGITAGLSGLGVHLPDEVSSLGGLMASVGNSVGRIAAGIGNSLTQKFSTGWRAVKSVFGAGMDHVKALARRWHPIDAIKSGWAAVAGWFGRRWADIKAAVGDGVRRVATVIADWHPIEAIKSVLLDGLHRLLVELPRQFMQLGAAIVKGIITGIKNTAGALKDSVVNLGRDVGGWFAGVLGIRSPSRVFREYGANTVEGYRRGVLDNQRRALAEVAAFGQFVSRVGAGAFGGVTFDRRPALPAAAPGAGMQVHMGSINVHAAPGMDERALAQYVAAEVQRALGAAERERAATRRSALYDTE